jgi:hypothetical protein
MTAIKFARRFAASRPAEADRFARRRARSTRRAAPERPPARRRHVRRVLEPLGYTILCVSVSACSGANPGSGGSDTTSGTSSSLDLPPCGDDPAKQPDKCIDDKGAERCKVHTGYAGDELALCPMDPDKGLVIHFGPKDYSDPEEMAKYIIGPGGEQEFCLHVNTTNDTERLFNAYHGRMRPNSHHLIVTMPSQHVDDDPSPWVCGPQVTDRWLFGSQESQMDVGVGSDPTLPKPGAPDYGLAHDLPPNQTLRLDFHNVNTTDQPQLREAWTSISYVDPSEVKVRADLIGFYNVGISIPPMAHTTTKRLRCEAPKDASGQEQPVYLNVLTGHAHSRLVRFSVWHDRTDGSSDLIYETHQWHEPGTALYRDGVENPVLPVPAGQAWGATSGYLQVLPGEAVSFECEYQNNLNQTVTIGETSKDEMCNVFGDYFPTVGGMWNCFGGN